MLPEIDYEIEVNFPQLAITGYKITSPQTRSYNCIAWAADVQDAGWWPNEYGYWPEGVAREETLEAFIAAYRTIGYEVCDSSDYEEGIDKITIFVNQGGVPTHASKQIDGVTWTSKLGGNYDISHTLFGLNSPIYGTPAIFMRRVKDNLNDDLKAIKDDRFDILVLLKKLIKQLYR